jgi:hypothetical protein
MTNLWLSVLLSDSIDPEKLRQAWLDYERLNPGQPRVDFSSFDGHGFEAKACDTPPGYDFRRVLGQVLLKVDEFCTIREIYQVGEKQPGPG